MVNKVTLIDTRTPYTGDCGTTLIGQYFRKAQNGGDSPALPRRKKGEPKRRFNVGLANENAYSMSVERLVNFPIRWRRKSDPPGTVNTGTLGTCGFEPEDASVTFTSNDDNELIAKLYSNVAGSSFNLAVTLAQTGQSLDLIASGATRIYTALKALRHGDIPKLARTLGVPVSPRYSGKAGRGSDNLTQTWLEYQYGWRPILQDVHDSAQLLATQLNRPQMKVFKVRKQKTASVSSGGAGFVLYGSDSTHTIRKQIVYKISEAQEISNASLSGFMDPALVAWELLPYSFVADWIFPVSSYLEARAALSKLEGKFITTTTVHRRRGGEVWPSEASSIEYIRQQVPFSYSIFTLDRVIGAPTLKAPELVPLGKALGWQRAVSALSLLNNFGR